MKYRLDFLTADILDELDKLDRLAQEYAKVADRIDLPPEDVPYYDL